MKSSNKIKIEGGMSSMTDLVFLLLIFFIIISTLVNTSHKIDLPEGSGDPSLTSPIKIYVDSLNNFYVNSDTNRYTIGKIRAAFNMTEPKGYLAEKYKWDVNNIGENNTIELLADKETDRSYAYEIIRLAKQNKLKVVIKTRGSK